MGLSKNIAYRLRTLRERPGCRNRRLPRKRTESVS